MQERGLDVSSALHEAEVDPRSLSNPAGRIALPAYVRLYDAVIRRLGDEAFGLFARPMPPGTFEFLCRGAAGAPCLDVALDRASRFLALVLPELEVTVARDGRRALLTIREVHRLRPQANDPCRVFAFEWLLRLLHALACWLAGRALALDSVRFPFPAPRHAGDYRLIYTEHSTFDAGDRLVAEFDAAFLDHPVRRDEADLALFLQGAPARIAMLYRRDRDLARQVRSILAAALPRSAGLETVARELHVSSRTLHRRLEGEGTSFRAIRDGLRRDIAFARLARPGESVARVAADLGFSEPSAFFRAFHGWTGQAPSAWRRRVRDGP